MSKLDPKFQAKLQDLVESGLGPDEIIQHFREEDKKKELAENEGVDEESIPEEIRVIAQALAYRGPEEGDLKPLCSLINAAYVPESNGGTESFRAGECISKEDLHELITGNQYNWLIVEAPGRTGDHGSSLILGATCYSTSGKSKKNGVVEGNLGSVRLFCVDPTFQHLFVGKRMLYRLEKALKAEGCVRAMFSIPSSRTRLARWLNFQGYDQVASVEYPSKYLGHVLTVEDVTLDMFSKSLVDLKPEPSVDFNAQGKESTYSDERPYQKNMHLPPHWRGVSSSANEEVSAVATIDINVEALLNDQATIDHSSKHDEIEIPDVD